MKFKSFSLKEGSNIVRFLTNPIKYFYHYHDGNKLETCFLNTNECCFCIGQNLQNIRATPRWLAGIRLLEDNNKYVLRFGTSLFKEIHNLVLSGSSKFGDPTAYDINLLCQNSKMINRVYQALPNGNKDHSEKDEELFSECMRLSNIMDSHLSESSLEEFKNLFLVCQKSSNSCELNNQLMDIVVKKYPQYLDVLKKLILFS